MQGPVEFRVYLGSLRTNGSSHLIYSFLFRPRPYTPRRYTKAIMNDGRKLVHSCHF